MYGISYMFRHYITILVLWMGVLCLVVRFVRAGCNHCCSEKSIGMIYECVLLALGIQHAMYMRHISICPPLQYVPTLSQKWHDFQKKNY
jgi:hypothetical protein